LTLNAKGEIVDKDGNVIDPDSLLIAADGTLMTQDGRVLDGEKVKNLVGAKQLEDGSVLLADGSIIKGATLDANGNLVMGDGTLTNAEDVSNVLNLRTSVDYLAGGISKDGVLTVQKLPVAK